jgi:hypothetical protein
MFGHDSLGCVSMPTDRGDDLERRERDLQVDLHVMDRHRVRIGLDVEPRRLLVAHGAADQQEVVTLAERTDPVLAVVEHLQRRTVVADGRRRKDRRGVEQVVGDGRIGHRCKVTEPDPGVPIGQTSWR